MIELIEVRKKFGERWITNGVNLTIPSGQITCIVGKSGEGKSVLLKQMIGLIRPTSGDIRIDNLSLVTGDEQMRRQLLKKCGYVFQFAALLDSLTILENVGLPLTEQGFSQDLLRPLIIEKLRMVNLDETILDKYPSELSGGMRKRVGIARTLLHNPSIIFYDEPTTGLDPVTSRIVYELMYATQKNLGVTSVVVSHDVTIFDYVDNIALLYEGTIKYFGSARTVWQDRNPYIYQFIRGLSQGPLV